MKLERQIRNCQKVQIPEPCPLKWDNLTRGDSDVVRHCSVCDRSVYYCATDEDAVSHAKRGHCIAMQVVSESELQLSVLGKPDVVSTNLEALYRHLVELEKQRAIRDATRSNRDCETCGYPIASFRKECWVCKAVAENRT